MSHPIQIVHFDHQYLVDYPEKLKALTQFYCKIWERDENFGEYRICPVCKTYFNYQSVEIDGMKYCTGKGNSTHPIKSLVLAWEPDKVAEGLMADSQGNFFGCLLINSENETIVGFSWALIYPLEHVRQTWGDDIVKLIEPETRFDEVAYYDEIAVDPSLRGMGFGKKLAIETCGWMANNYPDLMSILRTHKNSPARLIYEQLGYKVFAQDTEYGAGRVMLMINPCSSLKLTN